VSRVVYHRGNVPSGPFNPLAGVNVRRAHAERTRRTLFRSDGSIAGTEDRETLTLDTDASGPMLTGKQMRRLDSPAWRLLYLVRQAFHVLIGTAFLTIGSALVLSITYDITHSAGLALIAVAAFGGICFGISSST